VTGWHRSEHATPLVRTGDARRVVGGDSKAAYRLRHPKGSQCSRRGSVRTSRSAPPWRRMPTFAPETCRGCGGAARGNTSTIHLVVLNSSDNLPRGGEWIQHLTTATEQPFVNALTLPERRSGARSWHGYFEGLSTPPGTWARFRRGGVEPPTAPRGSTWTRSAAGNSSLRRASTCTRPRPRSPPSAHRGPGRSRGLSC
jgi:hypothetical protein